MTALLYKFNVIELGKDKFEMGLKEYVMVVSPIGFFPSDDVSGWEYRVLLSLAEFFADV